MMLGRSAAAAPPAAAARFARRQARCAARRASAVVSATLADDALCKDKVSAPKQYEGKSETQYTVTFVGAEGDRLEVKMPEDMYILNAAEANGLDLPATCRGGICGACVGRVVKGKVDQSDIADLSFVLEEKQIADGFALLCMSRPASDGIEIEAQCDWGNISMTEWKGATFFKKGVPRPLWEENSKN